MTPPDRLRPPPPRPAPLTPERAELAGPAQRPLPKAGAVFMTETGMQRPPAAKASPLEPPTSEQPTLNQSARERTRPTVARSGQSTVDRPIRGGNRLASEAPARPASAARAPRVGPALGAAPRPLLPETSDATPHPPASTAAPPALRPLLPGAGCEVPTRPGGRR